jgi:hypothetical protein
MSQERSFQQTYALSSPQPTSCWEAAVNFGSPSVAVPSPGAGRPACGRVPRLVRAATGRDSSRKGSAEPMLSPAGCGRGWTPSPASPHPSAAEPAVVHQAPWRCLPAFCEPRPVCLHNVSAVLSIRLMSEVLYARVPSETKGAIDAFAGANGRSVAAAVAELLSRGLQATSQTSQIAELQERLQRTELALARKDVELHEAKLALESFVQREGDRVPRRPGELPTSVRTAQEGS